jgi:hypothetical protein
MLLPVLGSLNQIMEEPVPRILNETLEPGIPLLIDHLYKKASMAAPVKKLDYFTEN